jgi:hypothetical protein
MISVMCYLAVFGVQHVDGAVVEKLITSMEPKKASVFFNFMLNPQNIDGWIRDQWKLLYDEEFVVHNLIEPVHAIGPAILGTRELTLLNGSCPGECCITKRTACTTSTSDDPKGF